MKRLHYLTLFSCLIVFLATPHPPAFAEDTYISAKAGVFFPAGDLDDANFDMGPSVEFALGRFVSPNLAIEAGVGIIFTGAESSFWDPTLGWIEEKDKLTIIPLTLTAKGVFASGAATPYIGVGVGLYIGFLDVDVTVEALGSDSDSDTATALGFHLVGGIQLPLQENISLGIEGKYALTGDAQASGTIFGAPLTIESDLNGFTLKANLAFSF